MRDYLLHVGSRFLGGFLWRGGGGGRYVGLLVIRGGSSCVGSMTLGTTN